MSSPFVSIIVANYNGKDVIEFCLRSLEKLNYPSYEVIVVDDASTDNSTEIIERKFPNTKLVKLPKNLGLAGANNEGFKFAKAGIIVFDLNNDEVVDEHWLSNLVKVLMSSPEIGITCGKRYQADEEFRKNRIILSAGSKISFITAECAPIGYGKGDSWEYNVQKESDFATVIAIKRNVLEKVGTFDPSYGNYYEDSDLSIRVRQAGYKIIYVPDAKSWHIGASSFGKDSYRRYYLLRRNQIRFIVKNFPLKFMILGLIHCFLVKTLIDTLFIVPPFKWVMRIFTLSNLSNLVIYVPKTSKIEILRAQKDAIVWNLMNLKSTLKARRYY
jgi:GT2 family glycosyltransferase